MRLIVVLVIFCERSKLTSILWIKTAIKICIFTSSDVVIYRLSLVEFRKKK